MCHHLFDDFVYIRAIFVCLFVCDKQQTHAVAINPFSWKKNYKCVYMTRYTIRASAHMYSYYHGSNAIKCQFHNKENEI